MASIGIIRNGGIEEIVTDSDVPNLLFGTSEIRSQKKERRDIGKALKKTGLEVFATNAPWPNDLYAISHRLVLSERDFGELAHGGNYIFGDGFVLVSGSVEDRLKKFLRDSAQFRQFFGRDLIIFTPPYEGRIAGIDGFELKTSHLDTTVGYVPSNRILSVNLSHYTQQQELFDCLIRRFGLTLFLTQSDGMPNNFYVIRHNGSPIVVANTQNNPFKDRQNGLRVLETPHEIVNLPGKFGGSVKCVVNYSPTPQLWDNLEIPYRRWGIALDSSYARH